MHLFLYIFFILSRRVNIVHEKNKNLLIVILNNGKTVRMMDKEIIKKNNANGVFNITGDITKLEQNSVFICGKLTDPGVVTCENQGSRIIFELKKLGNGTNIVTNDDLCLTKKGFDLKTNGYYLNLSKCNKTEEQLFSIVDLDDPEEINLKEKENLFYNRGSFSFGNHKINKMHHKIFSGDSRYNSERKNGAYIHEFQDVIDKNQITSYF